MKFFLIILLFPFAGFASSQTTASPGAESKWEFLFKNPAEHVLLIGEHHESPLHEFIVNALVMKSGSGKICMAYEGFTPNEGRNIRKAAPTACFFGIEDEILNNMGVFLKGYILLWKPNQRDIDIGERELRLIFSQLEKTDGFIIQQALKNTQNFNYVSAILRNNQPFDTEIIKHIAQEMSRIARDGQFLSADLLDIYDATISNPKNYDLFVQNFLVEARDLVFVKNILPIYQKALEENKPLIISVGSRHLDGLYDLLAEEGIKTKRLNLNNLSEEELFRLAYFIWDSLY